MKLTRPEQVTNQNANYYLGYDGWKHIAIEGDGCPCDRTQCVDNCNWFYNSRQATDWLVKNS